MVLIDTSYMLEKSKTALLCILLACQYYKEKFKHSYCLNEEIIKKYQLCENNMQSIIKK